MLAEDGEVTLFALPLRGQPEELTPTDWRVDRGLPRVALVLSLLENP
jgi:hypothetical protein